MVKRDPDDLISALSRNLKGKNSPILKFTFKRGALWQPQFAKAHSRKAKQQIKQKLKQQGNKQDNQYPLLVRFKQNKKQQTLRLNATTKLSQSQNFIDSVLSVFRVNFFKKKQQLKQKTLKSITKPNPQSKSTLKKQKNKQKNKQRKQKLKQIQRNKKKQLQKSKTMKKN